MITIAETAPFQRKIASLLTDEERAEFGNFAGLAELAGRVAVFVSSTTSIAR